MSAALTLDDLPAEILNEILAEAFAPDKNHWFRQLERRSILSRISPFCHHVIQGNTHFWDTLTIWRFTPPDSVDLWLEMSANSGITLRVHAESCRGRLEQWGQDRPNLHHAPIDEWVADVLPKLRPAASRVCNLHISSLKPARAMHTLADLVGYGLGGVEKLKLCVRERDIPNAVPTAFQTPPLLRTLVVDGVQPIISVPLAFSRITSLRLRFIHQPEDPDAPHLLDALAAATSLKLLRLDDVIAGPIEEGRRLLVPSLTHLWLSMSDEDSLPLVETLFAPSLTDLRVDLGPYVLLDELLSVGQELFQQAALLDITASRPRATEVADILASGSARVDVRACPGVLSCILELVEEDFLFPSVHRLRLPKNTAWPVLVDILWAARKGVFAPGFWCSTGDSFEEGQQRWHLDGETVRSTSFIEMDSWSDIGKTSRYI